MINSKPRINLGLIAWIIMFCSILIWGLGEVSAGSLGNTGNWYRIILVPLASILGLFALLNNGARLKQAFSGPVILLFVYGLVAVLSSINVPTYAFYSMWKGLEVIGVVLIAAAVLSYPDQMTVARSTYKITLVMFWILLGIYWIEAIVMPSQVFLPSRGYLPFTMRGFLPVYNGNTLAFLSAALTFSAVCNIFRARKTSKIIGLSVLASWAAVTLIFAQSRTSFLGLMVALLVYMYADRRFMATFIILITAIIATITTQVSDVAQQYVMRGQSEELFTSLSGRTGGWELAWQMFQQSPVAGHGFAAAARADILGTAGASTLHGAVFDVLVGVGLLGFIPWVIAIIWIITSLLKAWMNKKSSLWSGEERSIHAEMLGVMALILVRSTTSSGLAMHDHTFMLFLTVLVYALARTQHIRKAKKLMRNPVVS